jgi:hypothetical protein
MRGQNGTPGRLGRMRGQDELERERSRDRLDLGAFHTGPFELRQRVGERLASHPPLVLVLTASP